MHQPHQPHAAGDHPGVVSREQYGSAYQQSFPLTVRFLGAKGLSVDLAMEVAQSAWSKGWECREQLRDANCLLTWINSIALNASRGLLRRQQRFQSLPEISVAPRLDLAAVDVTRILNGCNPVERLILRQHHLDERPIQEIALENGCSETAMRIRLLRARRAARLRLQSALALWILLFAASPFVHAQDARQIVQRSLFVAERSWAANHTYTYIERDEETHLDGAGHIHSTDVQVSKAIVVNGDTFEETVSHNGKPPTPEKVKKEQEGLRKRENETPQEREARLKEQADDRAFIREMPDAFNFQILSDDLVDGRPAYVLEALPKPDYHAHSKYGKMFSKVHGKLWVDKQDFGWVKVEANVVASFSMFVLARVEPGTHIIFEQTRVADGIWLPKSVLVKADAKIMFLKNYQLQEQITYSDYRPSPATGKVLEVTPQVARHTSATR